MTETIQEKRLVPGTIVRLDYTLSVDGKILETTSEEVAKAADVMKANRKYGPRVFMLGSGQLIPGFDEHVQSNAEVGKQVTANLPPEKAFGNRQPLEVIPLAKFGADKASVKVGAVFTRDGKKSTVTKVAGGRVVVDSNHELAGKSLNYEYTVREVVKGDDDFVSAVAEMVLGWNAFASVGKEFINVNVPESQRFNQQLPMLKIQIVQQIFSKVRKDVLFIERFAAPQPAPETPPVEVPA